MNLINEKVTHKNKTIGSGVIVEQKRANARTNYAFKCNYCDGNADSMKIGFAGVCSDKIIYNNIIVEPKSWCVQDTCPCMQYHSGEITREQLESEVSVCYESEMLTKWKVYAGMNAEGTARRISELSPDKLCVLTTRDPKAESEAERYIFAAFIIGAGDEGDEYESGCIYAKTDYTICFNSEEAHRIKFWDYHKNANAPEEKIWRMGLYRKFEDDEALKFLDAIVSVKSGTVDQAQAERLRDYFIQRNNIVTS
ncbi:MAG: hypothetical protein HUJ78_05655 [Mogibacterium sp.]|nr:hypothetical protein [Mogibacterium sp.]